MAFKFEFKQNYKQNKTSYNLNFILAWLQYLQISYWYNYTFERTCWNVSIVLSCDNGFISKKLCCDYFALIIYNLKKEKISKTKILIIKIKKKNIINRWRKLRMTVFGLISIVKWLYLWLIIFRSKSLLHIRNDW